MQMTDIKNIVQAKRSFAKHSPERKYATANKTKSKSDIFVLEE